MLIPNDRGGVSGVKGLSESVARSSAAPVAKTPTTESGFAALGLTPALLKNVEGEGYSTPTPIQAQAIPPLLAGRDVLGCAQTGTGKTAAFALPILQRLSAERVAGPRLPRVLVLAPTRELATQIAQSFGVYGRGTGLRGTVIFGGVGQNPQVQALRHGVDVLVATPGRLIDLMEQRLVDLSGVRVLVLDEADRMLDMGFIQPIRRIVGALPKGSPRQTLLFSATMPKEIMHLADSLLREPVKVTVTPVTSAVPLIEQKIYHVSRTEKLTLLGHLLETESVTKGVVFTKTKHGADKLCRKLHAAGFSATAIHGNKGQNQRDRALDAFKTGRVRILVATDVAARGLDVDGITHVFNYDLPMEPEAYIHRIGRTGRAGATGRAVSMCDPQERDLLRDIERLTGKRIPTATAPSGLPALRMRELPSHERMAATHPPVPGHANGHGHSAGHGRPRHAGSATGQTRPDHGASGGRGAHATSRGHGHAGGHSGHGGSHAGAPAQRSGWQSAGRGRRGR